MTNNNNNIYNVRNHSNTTQDNTNDITDYITDDISDDNITDNEIENYTQTSLDNDYDIHYQNYNNNHREFDLLKFENSINESIHNVINIMNQIDNRDKLWKKLNKISQMLADISILTSRII
jgi:hypothetical protein